jgi:taurine dioxygenase
MSFTATPPRATLLHAREVPVRDGVVLGSTDFASAAAAHASLPAEIRARIGGLTVVHDVFGRRAKSVSHTQQDDLRRQQPKVDHPFVRTHAHTGAKCLYVSAGECTNIHGMDDGEAFQIIQKMTELISSPEFRYRHEWQQGDVLIWDNCAVQHRANFDYHWPQERRLMWRITVGGGATA